MSSFSTSLKNATQDIGLLAHSRPKPALGPKATINVSKLVRETCSIYMSKGRLNSTASKLISTKPKCMRMGRELEILEKRFKIR